MRIPIVGSSAGPGADNLVTVVHEGKLGFVSLNVRAGIKCWGDLMEQPAGRRN